MGNSALVIAAALAAYAFMEYRRRELAHQERLAASRDGTRPAEPAGEMVWWKIAAIGAVAILLAGMLFLLLSLEFKTGVKFGPFAQVSVFFGLLLVLVTLMLFSALARRSAGSKREAES